ncbi:MAG: UDP-N-acetylmuramoyl-L-alanine--D-glutamate ligase [Burkholderiales bacterium]|nr:UDP-N-acetylmuramoyl-L-alanine--D-glutamate ligase [Betaproteobacteria bacterium]
MNWHDKSVLVLGAGDTGLSVVGYLGRMGARVRVADSRDRPPGADDIRSLGYELVTGPWTDGLFSDAELVVASPGVAVAGPACDPAIKRAVAAGKKFVGDIELFAWKQNEITGSKPKVIGITGSNGKSTVTAMTGAMCAAAGLQTVVTGNIGLPVLDALAAAESSGQPDVYVIELSSFQLETTSSLRLDAATMLNLSQDHLDRYAGMAAYAAAKQRIFLHATHQIVNRDDAISMSMKEARCECTSFGLDQPTKDKNFGLADGWLVRGKQKLVPFSSLPVAGLHNAANALAAFALCDAIGVNLAGAAGGLKSFTGLPHRSARVAVIQGVTFLDDSKGTNVGSTVAAMNGMTTPTILIAGGEGKEQDFAPLAEPVKKHAKTVVLIGKAAQQIQSAIASSSVPCFHAADMDAAVRLAFTHASPGDTVLLSPACASFDMFKNYKHRGEVFAASVASLAKADEKREEHPNA